MKLSTDFIVDTVGKYTNAIENMGTGCLGIATVCSIIDGNALMVAFASSVTTVSVMQRLKAQGFAAEYFRQKDAQPSVAPKGP